MVGAEMAHIKDLYRQGKRCAIFGGLLKDMDRDWRANI